MSVSRHLQKWKSVLDPTFLANRLEISVLKVLLTARLEEQSTIAFTYFGLITVMPFITQSTSLFKTCMRLTSHTAPPLMHCWVRGQESGPCARYVFTTTTWDLVITHLCCLVKAGTTQRDCLSKKTVRKNKVVRVTPYFVNRLAIIQQVFKWRKRNVSVVQTTMNESTCYLITSPN